MTPQSVEVGKPDLACLVIGFNRPEKLSQALDSILQSGISKVYISIDGPRINKETDAALVAECLKVARSFSSAFELFELKANKTNLGCKGGVVEAINWFFRNEKFGIIVEDDIIITKDFVQFVSWCEKEYETNLEIWHINGWSPFERGEIPESVWATKVPIVWGWATWADRWDHYTPDLDIDWILRVGELETNLRFPATKTFLEYWQAAFTQIKEGLDTWDYQWVNCIWRNGGVAISPPFRLVQNIGFDATATHTFESHGRSAYPIDRMGLNPKLYGSLVINSELIAASDYLNFRISDNSKSLLKHRKHLLSFYKSAGISKTKVKKFNREAVKSFHKTHRIIDLNFKNQAELGAVKEWKNLRTAGPEHSLSTHILRRRLLILSSQLGLSTHILRRRLLILSSQLRLSTHILRRRLLILSSQLRLSTHILRRRLLILSSQLRLLGHKIMRRLIRFIWFFYFGVKSRIKKKSV